MKKTLLILPLLLLSLFSKAQCYNPPCPCVDSTTIDIYHYCANDAFNPVCACDGNTYRSPCAAQYRGGIVNAQYLSTGICGDYFIDFVPIPVVPGSSDPNYNSYGTLSIYVNYTETALIQIYDVYGKVWFVQQAVVNVPYPIYSLPIYMDGFPAGIYYLFVIINGEEQKVKIMKADRE